MTNEDKLEKLCDDMDKLSNKIDEIGKEINNINILIDNKDKTHKCYLCNKLINLWKDLSNKKWNFKR